jgi:hypothetical protein
MTEHTTDQGFIYRGVYMDKHSKRWTAIWGRADDKRAIHDTLAGVSKLASLEEAKEAALANPPTW